MYLQTRSCINTTARGCNRLFATQIKPKVKVTEEERLNEWNNAKPYSEVPGDTVFKLIRGFLPGGNYHKQNFIDILATGHKIHGGIYRMPGTFGKSDMVITNNVDDFEKCFRNEGIWPHRRGMDTMNHFRKDIKTDFYKDAMGLVTSTGEEWGKFRTAVNPVMMNPSSMKAYLPQLNRVNKEFVERIRKIRDAKTLQVPATFENEINRWTFESIAAVAVDKHLGLIRHEGDNSEAELLFREFKKLFQLFVELDIKPPLWKVIRTKKYYEMMNTLESVHNITSSYVNEAFDRINKSGNDTRDESEKSVFEKLLKVDKKIATVMAMDLLFAGVDTTTATFTSILVALAKNPEQQAILRKEIMQILPQKEPALQPEDMSTLPYLRACIKESMRIYPLGTGNMRAPAVDIVLSGYQVPKGTDVVMNSQTLLRDPRYYPQPNEFLPERWLRSNENQSECPSARGRNPFVFLPFGFGPRMCAGKRIVDLELETGVATIIRNFKIEFDTPDENIFTWDPFLKPIVPLTFKFTELEK